MITMWGAWAAATVNRANTASSAAVTLDPNISANRRPAPKGQEAVSTQEIIPQDRQGRPPLHHTQIAVRNHDISLASGLGCNAMKVGTGTTQGLARRVGQ
jgi:hypothetical protein